MNPLTLVKRIQKLNSIESSLGISEEASWHSKYKDSAYVYVGGIPFDLTEGDLLAVFAQYGEIVDVNLVRDKGTGKSKGFAFLAYEDQRSTILAVDNLNGAKILGRIVRVDHVSKYKKKEEEEDEEKGKQKREARGVCRAFQRGDCNRGDSCKFSHDEQRNANTGWGAQDSNSRWGHEMYEDPLSRNRMSTNNTLSRTPDDVSYRRSHLKQDELTLKDQKYSGEKLLERHGKETRTKEKDTERQTSEKQSGRYNSEPTRENDQDRRRDKRSSHDRDSSSQHHRGR